MNPNNNDDTYHNTDRKLSISENELIRNVGAHLYENHQWLSMPPESRISLQSLKEMESLGTLKNSIDNDDFSNVHVCRQLQGIVKWYNYYRGYGFIECIGFNRNIFVHRSAIVGQPFKWRYLNDGENILFNVVKGRRGPEAAKVVSIEPYYYNIYYQYPYRR